MYVCALMSICIGVCVCAYVIVCVCICVCVYVSVSVSVSVHVICSVCAVYVCICVTVSVYLYPYRMKRLDIYVYAIYIHIIGHNWHLKEIGTTQGIPCRTEVNSLCIDFATSNAPFTNNSCAPRSLLPTLAAPCLATNASVCIELCAWPADCASSSYQ